MSKRHNSMFYYMKQVSKFTTRSRWLFLLLLIRGLAFSTGHYKFLENALILLPDEKNHCRYNYEPNKTSGLKCNAKEHDETELLTS
jgi:hypothetical protein